MKNLLNPKWIFGIAVFPLLILLFLFLSEYQIIKTLLDTDAKLFWIGLVITLVSIILAHSYYAFNLIKRKESIPIYYAIVNLLVNISFLFWYVEHIRDIIPWSIPNWMVPANLELYGYTFLMPTMMHALMILVIYLTPKERKKGIPSIVKALFIPMVWYISSLIIPSFFGYGFRFYKTMQLLVSLFGVASGVLFLFFIAQTIYNYIQRKDDWNPMEHVLLRALIVIIFPLLGLALNQGMGVFGNFSNPWFYIIAFINGVLLILPNRDKPFYRLFVFLGRSVGFVYIIYFFFVLMPYLPLSVFAIIIFGAGFLMMTPLFIFIMQMMQLRDDINYLSKHFENWKLVVTMIVGLLVIPFSLTNSFLHDKSTLTEALEYVYSKDASKDYQIDISSLETALTVLHDQKRRWDSGESGPIPFITTYYQWLVLDNLMLSYSKQSKLKEVFLGKPRNTVYRPANRDISTVKISNISSQSHFDEKTQIWISWIDLELKNANDNRFGIYISDFELPVGAWISDYYLYVGNKREPGILAEKKAANWIFNQIRNRNRDPGLLTYIDGNHVEFKVFPFEIDEIRKTGIEIMHKEPLDFQLDGHIVHLGDETHISNLKSTIKDEVIYVSSKEKSKLPKVNRKPYFHFLVDVSKGSKNDEDTIISTIKNILELDPERKSTAKISLINYKRYDIDIHSDWEAQIRKQTREGGFYVDNFMKDILVEDYENINNFYPELMIVNNTQNIHYSFPNYDFTHPDIDYYNHVFDGDKQAFSLATGDTLQTQFQVKKQVYAFPNSSNPIAFLPVNEHASIVVKSTFPRWDFENIQKNWTSGLYMEGQRRYEVLHPEYGNENWLDMIRNSFKSHIMIPYTSYIVVENEAQKAMLYKKQKEVLNGNKHLDLEETVSMSEPSIWWFLILFIGFFAWKKLVWRMWN